MTANTGDDDNISVGEVPSVLSISLAYNISNEADCHFMKQSECYMFEACIA